MNRKDIEAFSQIPQPPREAMTFIDDLRSAPVYLFPEGTGCPAGVTRECMRNGAELRVEYPAGEEILETAFLSLRRVLQAKGIPERPGAYPIRFQQDGSLQAEEYFVSATAESCVVKASDSAGMRRGIYR